MCSVSALPTSCHGSPGGRLGHRAPSAGSRAGQARWPTRSSSASPTAGTSPPRRPGRTSCAGSRDCPAPSPRSRSSTRGAARSRVWTSPGVSTGCSSSSTGASSTSGSAWPNESLEDFLMREKRRELRISQLTGWVCIRIGWADLENLVWRPASGPSWTHGAPPPDRPSPSAYDRWPRHGLWPLQPPRCAGNPAAAGFPATGRRRTPRTPGGPCRGRPACWPARTRGPWSARSSPAARALSSLACVSAMPASSLETMSSARADFSGSERFHWSSSTERMACSTLRMRPSRSFIRSRGTLPASSHLSAMSRKAFLTASRSAPRHAAAGRVPRPRRAGPP